MQMQFSLVKQEAFLQGLATLKNLVIEPNCWRAVASLICTYCSTKLREIGYFSLLFPQLKLFTLLKTTNLWKPLVIEFLPQLLVIS